MVVKWGGAMKQQKYKVLYTVKNDSGFLVDKTKKFTSLHEAYEFIKSLNSSGKLVGKAELGE
jgi:hypothetical protein